MRISFLKLNILLPFFVTQNAGVSDENYDYNPQPFGIQEIPEKGKEWSGFRKENNGQYNPASYVLTPAYAQFLQNGNHEYTAPREYGRNIQITLPIYDYNNAQQPRTSNLGPTYNNYDYGPGDGAYAQYAQNEPNYPQTNIDKRNGGYTNNAAYVHGTYGVKPQNRPDFNGASSLDRQYNSMIRNPTHATTKTNNAGVLMQKGPGLMRIVPKNLIKQSNVAPQLLAGKYINSDENIRSNQGFHYLGDRTGNTSKLNKNRSGEGLNLTSKEQKLEDYKNKQLEYIHDLLAAPETGGNITFIHIDTKLPLKVNGKIIGTPLPRDQIIRYFNKSLEQNLRNIRGKPHGYQGNNDNLGQKSQGIAGNNFYGKVDPNYQILNSGFSGGGQSIKAQNMITLPKPNDPSLYLKSSVQNQYHQSQYQNNYQVNQNLNPQKLLHLYPYTKNYNSYQNVVSVKPHLQDENPENIYSDYQAYDQTLKQNRDIFKNQNYDQYQTQKRQFQNFLNYTESQNHDFNHKNPIQQNINNPGNTIEVLIENSTPNNLAVKQNINKKYVVLPFNDFGVHNASTNQYQIADVTSFNLKPKNKLEIKNKNPGNHIIGQNPGLKISYIRQDSNVKPEDLTRETESNPKNQTEEANVNPGNQIGKIDPSIKNQSKEPNLNPVNKKGNSNPNPENQTGKETPDPEKQIGGQNPYLEITSKRNIPESENTTVKKNVSTELDYYDIPIKWDFGIPTLKVASETTLVTATEVTLTSKIEVETVSVPFESRQVLAAKQAMLQHRMGYFLGFVHQLFTIVANKETENARELMQAHRKIIYDMVDTGLLKDIGEPALTTLKQSTDYTVQAPTEIVKIYLEGSIVKIDNRAVAFEADIVELLDIIDSAYNVEQGEKLLKTLDEVHDYPAEGRTAMVVMKDVTDGLLQAFWSAPVPNRARLFEMLNNAINARADVIYTLRNGKPRDTGFDKGEQINKQNENNDKHENNFKVYVTADSHEENDEPENKTNYQSNKIIVRRTDDTVKRQYHYKMDRFEVEDVINKYKNEDKIKINLRHLSTGKNTKQTRGIRKNYQDNKFDEDAYRYKVFKMYPLVTIVDKQTEFVTTKKIIPKPRIYTNFNKNGESNQANELNRRKNDRMASRHSRNKLKQKQYQNVSNSEYSIRNKHKNHDIGRGLLKRIHVLNSKVTTEQCTTPHINTASEMSHEIDDDSYDREIRMRAVKPK